MDTRDLKAAIREIPDFPKPGINFYDLSTLFRDGAAFGAAVEAMARRYSGAGLSALAAIEARGFVLASAIARDLGLGLILVRKMGKLPAAAESESYDLEYGKATIEVHRDAAGPGDRVLIVDDLLATGGTAVAAGRVLGRLGAEVAGYAFLVELAFLNGRGRLGSSEVFSLIRYD